MVNGRDGSSSSLLAQSSRAAENRETLLAVPGGIQERPATAENAIHKVVVSMVEGEEVLGGK